MNGSDDIPITLSSTPDARPCSLVSVIPKLGMSSCRGRAEAFARRLSSKLRTLGSQTDDDQLSPDEEAPIINCTNTTTNTWMPAQETAQTVTDLQPLRHESDSLFDFDCELESPGSPVDECEYLRLIETASNTPHNSAAESGYVCASAASSHSSSDGPYFDITNSESSGTVQLQAGTVLELPELHVNSLKINGIDSARLCNGNHEEETQEESELPSYSQSCDVTDFQKAKPLESKAATENATPNQRDNNTTAPVVLSIQDQIINALHEESNKANSSNHSTNKGLCNKFNIEECKPTTVLADISVQQPNTNGFSNESKKPLDNAAQDENDAQVAQARLNAETDKQNKSLLLSVDDAKLTKSKRSESSTHLGNLDTTDDEDDCRPQRVRRCSSLKTGKTPPGTPGRKKIVRFADVLGLDLADIKTFLDEIPTIPKSAFEDLEILDADGPIQLGPKSNKLLMPLFQQPGGMANFLDLVRAKQVSLENAAVTDHINQTITGSVRVRNLDFHKSVHIRYTLDGWRSYADLQANYVENTCDGFSDKFTFVLFGNSMQIGQRLEFAVRFQCKGQQFWDNNYGTNYCFQCLPTTTTTTTTMTTATAINTIIPPSNSRQQTTAGPFSPNAGDAWCTSFY